MYISERLGGIPSLRYLGGRDQTSYARVRDFKKKGEWISLKELLTYMDIGSQGSRPWISYFEAGAFVKFLIETYGKDNFLEVFKTLKSSEDPEVCRHNQEELERIYGFPLQKLGGRLGACIPAGQPLICGYSKGRIADPKKQFKKPRTFSPETLGFFYNQRSPRTIQAKLPDNTAR